MGSDHPVSWCKDYKGGRSFYTALGNTAGSFGEADFRTHLEGAIDWTAGVADPVYSDCGATVLANYQQTKISGPPNLSEPIGFDQLPDGRVIQTDRRGGVRLHDPATGTSQVTRDRSRSTPTARTACTARAIDHNFATNNWVYLYYAPPNVDNITLLRRDDGSHATTSTRPPAGRTARVRPRPSTSPTTTPGSATSSCRGSSSSTTPRATRRTSTSRREQQIMRVTEQPRRLLPRGRRHRLRQARQPLARRPATTAPPAAATPATGVRASTSGPTRTRRSA